ncbi:DUF3048 domain-containing protein [Streptomyces zagrosensis]|uniref:CchlO n=1 Tax=Streptomyces zagrosensis TaxID=1042984 RepID=A0A7W9UZQ1_9ACTN|nr:DUF3048 domain-containing protein [Streptomyces zagrosensis]MBB5936586.1 hypothetical protein [Streptomyces zagrosensis]
MEKKQRRVVALCAAATTALALAVAGCNDDGGPPQDGTSPFTGLKARDAPVLAVKIDNVGAARPQSGLAMADIVYVERVEAGLSRLMAVYSSQLPSTIGPVRSARETDLELLRQFGRPAFAYSGAQSKLLPLLKAAAAHTVPPERLPDGYTRSQDRPAPHNLYLRPERALAAASEADDAKDIGFRFGAPPKGGRATPSYTVRYPAAAISFAWSGERERWRVSMDGAAVPVADAKGRGPATVVVQGVTIKPSRFHDRSGSATPYTDTTGSGPALVLREGKTHKARWSRPSATRGTEFSTPDGDRLAFARGPVWVAYVPKEAVTSGAAGTSR